jgi:hypothetical protein
MNKTLTKLVSIFTTLLMGIVIIFSTATPSYSADTMSSFLQKYGDDLYNAAKSWNIPEKVMLAQAQVEQSFNSNSTVAGKWNLWNYQALPSGITKLPGYAGTHGKTSNRGPEAYAVWDTVGQDAYGYGYFLANNSRYGKAFEHATDPVAFADALGTAGYAEAGGYAKRLQAGFSAADSASASTGKPLFLPTQNGKGDGKGFVSKDSGASTTNSEPAKSEQKALAKMVDEDKLVGMSSPKKLGSDDNAIPKAPTSDELSLADKANIGALQKNKNIQDQFSQAGFLGVLLPITGILLILYGLILLCCLLFDRANTIFDFSAVEFITHGNIRREYSKYEQGKDKGFILKVLSKIGISILIGALLLSGLIPAAITNIIMEINNENSINSSTAAFISQIFIY